MPNGPNRGSDPVSSHQRTTSEGVIVTNRALVAMLQAEFQVVRSSLSWLRLSPHAMLYQPGAELDFVYFPNRGLVSRLVAMRDGKTVEVGVIGAEGLVGAEGMAGGVRAPHRVISLCSGDGTRIRTEILKTLLPALPHFQSLIYREALLQGVQSAQWAACNRLHSAEQRLARWLLTMHERTEEDVLFVTHGFLASLLGTDRPSVSLSANLLQKKGAIEYSRGTVRIVDRQRLVQSVCECYEVMQRAAYPPEIR